MTGTEQSPMDMVKIAASWTGPASDDHHEVALSSELHTFGAHRIHTGSLEIGHLTLACILIQTEQSLKYIFIMVSMISHVFYNLTDDLTYFSKKIH